ncbi:MAG: hypothetical protein GY845_37800 [Planctomycetes bacterium]|nr:hypothetical protein [Planctomycetota bacterium]
MKCPMCSSEMDQGKASVRSTILGFLYGSLLPLHCWFEPQATGRKKIIVRNRSGFHIRDDSEVVNPPAYHCKECGTSVIIGAKRT